ncbi:TetR/AcrR family transcriptional regulator [Bhargavaea massiliensis]|uniref:TetR/AcrR family transcriptional regulator n=1 Tax=Bhargavaea massiliensis TaxID=2697500 RepID=UPI001BD038FB|nr:TetR/AcrR family transcriptional regulator [Bhargavaea massiliensis]
MRNKQLQMSRMWKYFVEATVEIIHEEGIDKVTIRKVADRAGYNSATLYNYFSELSHLKFFAAMRLLGGYTEEVTARMEDGETPLDKYLIAWECFIRHSFRSPKLFNAVFIMDLGDQPGKLMQRYYEVYPAELVNVPDELQPTLFERSVMQRGKSMLQMAAEEGQIPMEQMNPVNEKTNLIWQGMMTNILNHRLDYDIGQAERNTMNYIREIIEDARTQ